MNDVFEKNSRLQKENTELSGIIRSIPVGLSVYRLKQSQAELVAINDAACAIFCITQKEIDDGSQTAFSARVHPEDLGAQVVYMNGHLPKPLDPQMLLEMLQQEIRKAESGQ